MKKSECETSIRHLCYKWAEAEGIPMRPDFQPSFIQFKTWMHASGYGGYLNFRSDRGPNEDASDWFDDVFGQGWRN